MTGQSSASPFMSNRDGTERKVSYNIRGELGDKIDKLAVVMSRLAAKDSHEKRPSKPQVYKSRGQSKSYNQGGYQSRSNRLETENSMGIIGLDKTIGTTIFKETLEDMEGRTIEENIEVLGVMNMIEVEIGQEKEHFQETMVTIELGVPVTVDQDQDLELVPIWAG